VTPIEKVLEMMNGMVDKGVAAKQEEEVKFAAFYQWCTTQQRIKNEEIEVGWNKIQELKAQIEKHASDIAGLTDRIEELDADVDRWEKDQKAATAVRDKENVDFKATVTDYTESLTAIAGAIQVLSAQQGDTAQAEFVQSLLQVQKSRVVPMSAKRALLSFIQMHQPVADSVPDAMPDDRLAYEAPEAAGYSSQSGGVVEMLSKLEDEFKEKKTELEKEELGAQQAFAQIIQQLRTTSRTQSMKLTRRPLFGPRPRRQRLRPKAILRRHLLTEARIRHILRTQRPCAHKRRQISTPARS